MNKDDKMLHFIHQILDMAQLDARKSEELVNDVQDILHCMESFIQRYENNDSSAKKFEQFFWLQGKTRIDEVSASANSSYNKIKAGHPLKFNRFV
jgi:hypothetical protein